MVRKEIYGIFNTKNPTEGQIRDYKSWFDDGLYIIEELALKIILHYRIPAATEFRSKLGFKQLYITLPKEVSLLESVIDAFEGESMQTQYKVLSYKIDLYFLHYKLAIEVVEKGHKDRNIDYEIKRRKAIEK